MLKIDKLKLKSFYEDMPSVWPENDEWHNYSKSQIETYISSLKIPSNHYILNAGSGGNDYGLTSCDMHHLDIAENKICNFPKHTVGSIEELPFEDSIFDMIICVGSVINYTDAMNSISELSRVLKKGGSMILEFESSWGFEHLGTDAFKQNATIVNLQYNSEDHVQWIYGPKYIHSIIKNHHFNVVEEYRFHFLSALSYRLTHSENKAAKWTIFDSLINKFPFVNQYSNNVILKCKKL